MKLGSLCNAAQGKGVGQWKSRQGKTLLTPSPHSQEATRAPEDARLREGLVVGC